MSHRASGLTGFSKASRLLKRADYLRLSDSPNRFATSAFLLVWLPNDRDIPRIGITASKKTGCAVVRNRIKRYVREVYRRRQGCLGGVDINVIARREAARINYQGAEMELEHAFSRIANMPCVRRSHSSESEPTGN